MITVGVIGTAGRKGHHSSLSKELFQSMVAESEATITQELKLSWNKVHLVSGGAAWADHVAVTLFHKYHLEGTKLTLYFPCQFTKDEFEDTGKSDWRVNPGRTANKLHRLFSDSVGRDTLKEIHEASQLGATLDCGSKGFHARNTKVAKSQDLIAITWGKTEPEDGGTKDTWTKKHGGNKVHISLHNLQAKLDPSINTEDTVSKPKPTASSNKRKQDNSSSSSAKVPKEN